MGRAGSFTNQLEGYKAFQPTQLPPDRPLAQDDELNYLAAQATLAVGKLSGLAAIIPDPDIFVYLDLRTLMRSSSGVA